MIIKEKIEMADYILDLRRKVGNMPLIVSCSASIVLNERNEILLIHRTDNNCWALPAGCIELGETVEEAARREVFEETGLVLGNVEFLGVYSGKEMHYTYPNGDEIYCIANVFKSNDFTGTIAADGIESEDVKFFDLKYIPDNIHIPDKPVVLDFIKKIIEME
jgi:8-oxo-dGTP pyrophosphatase MutT (NUDIX family)